MGRFSEQVDELLSITGELTDDDELIEATRELRDLAVEHDEVNERFEQAMFKVRRMLYDRLHR